MPSARMRAFVIDVAKKKIERGKALGEALFDLRPFTCGNDARNQIVGEDALGTFLAAVNGEGDAFLKESEIGGLLTFAELFGSETKQGALQRLVMRASQIGGLKHFVISHVKAVVQESRRDKQARLSDGGHRWFGGLPFPSNDKRHSFRTAA